MLVVVLEAVDCFEVAGGGRSAQSRKEGLFFIRCVPFPANVKILKRRLHGRPLFAGKASGMRTFSNHTQDVEEMLNPAMAVFQHADRIIESAVWFCAYLYRHLAAFCL